MHKYSQSTDYSIYFCIDFFKGRRKLNSKMETFMFVTMTLGTWKSSIVRENRFRRDYLYTSFIYETTELSSSMSFRILNDRADNYFWGPFCVSYLLRLCHETCNDQDLRWTCARNFGDSTLEIYNEIVLSIKEVYKIGLIDSIDLVTSNIEVSNFN